MNIIYTFLYEADYIWPIINKLGYRYILMSQYILICYKDSTTSILKYNNDKKKNTFIYNVLSWSFFFVIFTYFLKLLLAGF